MIEEAPGVIDPQVGGSDIGRREAGLKFWLLWVAAGAAGFLLGQAVYAVLIDYLGDEIARASILIARGEIIRLALALAFVFAVRGTAVGTAHWLVLRTQLPLAGWWVIAADAAYGLAEALFGLGPTVMLGLELHQVAASSPSRQDRTRLRYIGRRPPCVWPAQIRLSLCR